MANPLFGGHPIPRMVLFLDELFLKEEYFEQKYFKITFNQNFRDVISNCQNIKREGQNGT
jgi:leucyl/phenylalanyl-tRNA--protein transferase